jgi:hypothetical protein
MRRRNDESLTLWLFTMDGRVIGERSDAVLRPAMPGHDERWVLAERTRGVRQSNSVLAERTREVFEAAFWRNEPEAACARRLIVVIEEF